MLAAYYSQNFRGIDKSSQLEGIAFWSVDKRVVKFNMNKQTHHSSAYSNQLTIGFNPFPAIPISIVVITFSIVVITFFLSIYL